MRVADRRPQPVLDKGMETAERVFCSPHIRDARVEYGGPFRTSAGTPDLRGNSRLNPGTPTDLEPAIILTVNSKSPTHLDSHRIRGD